MRELDTSEYVSMLRELAESGHEVSVPIRGGSMSPFLEDGRDTAYFSAPQRELRVGDIVFFQRENGAYILHRICRIADGGYYIVGDAQLNPEGPVPRESIFGLVTQVRRKGKTLSQGDFVWDFFAGFWLRKLPKRERLLKLYGYLR